MPQSQEGQERTDEQGSLPDDGDRDAAAGTLESPLADLHDLTVDVLEPHAMFMNAGKDDDTRYFLPAAALIALGWVAVKVVVPVLVGVATGVGTEIAKRHLARSKAQPSDSEKQELVQQIAQLREADAIRDDRLATAVEALTEVLKSNGWPAGMAADDAGTIVARVTEKVGAV